MGDAHLLGRRMRVQVARRRHRGLRPRPPINDLMGAIVVLVITLTGHDLTDQRQPLRGGPRLGLGVGGGRVGRGPRAAAATGGERQGKE